MTAIPRDPPANTPGIRTLGTGAQQAAPGNDTRFPQSGTLTVKVSYRGTPGASVFYQSSDLAGNLLSARTNSGVTESPRIPGLFYFNQLVALDQFVAQWDEGDPTDYAVEVVATRHVATLPSAPTSVTAVGGNHSATISFTPGDDGGSAILSYTVTATDVTTPANGGQVVVGSQSPIIVTGLTNGESYTFTVTATTNIGTSVASTASNAVTPAVILFAPDAPTNAQAVVTGSGQVTVTFDAPLNNGGSAITSYLVSAVDETNSAHNTTHAGASPNVLTGLVNGEVYHFTVHAVNVIGTSPESVASNSVTPSGSGGIATFTYSQPGSTIILLDATGSTGSLVWAVDGVNAVATTTTLLIGPLRVGTHHVKLTATSGGAAITEQDIDVAWVARPFKDAQHDATNGPTHTGTWGNHPTISGSTLIAQHNASELPQWASLPDLAPWRNKPTLNMVEGGFGDGDARITAISDDHISLFARFGDRPALDGGYRTSLEMSSSYDANQNSSGHEFHVQSGPDQGIDLTGMGLTTTPTGHGSLRFFRCSFLIPSSNPSPLLHVNNFFEFHGGSGAGTIIFNTNGTGTTTRWTLQGQINGIQQTPLIFDDSPLLYDTWYDYVIEFKFETDPAVGYMRVYRDRHDGAGMVVIPIALCPSGTVSTAGANYGKKFAYTTATTSAGVALYQNPIAEMYVTRTEVNTIYINSGGSTVPQDLTVEYKNWAIGPSFNSVMRPFA